MTITETKQSQTFFLKNYLKELNDGEISSDPPDSKQHHSNLWLVASINMDVRYFPKEFSQGATSHGYFPKQQLPKSVLATALGLHSLFQPQRSAPIAACDASEGLNQPLGSCRFGNCTFWKLYIWKIATWEIVTWEVALGKFLRENT